MISIEKISEIVAQIREKDYELVKPEDKFDDLGIDSLGRLMVIISVATELGIEGTESELVASVYELKTIGDLISYVEHRAG